MKMCSVIKVRNLLVEQGYECCDPDYMSFPCVVVLTDKEKLIEDVDNIQKFLESKGVDFSRSHKATCTPNVGGSYCPEWGASIHVSHVLDDMLKL